MHHGYMFPKYGDKDTGSFVYHINMENFCKDFHDILNLDLIQVIRDKRPLVKCLTQFSLMFHVYTLWKRQENFDMLTYSASIEMEHWAKMG